ncbi:MAG TPA: LLM class F420-dependent oxidoreductase [Acidimicrobiales bacterium]|jgi:probable F420-dependent oxidoreductase|nr:LLM class F420-dependent oxidoreductase [Acidimicrobiales bacterium]
MTTERYGITIPFDGVPLAEHRSWYVELADLGYTDVWSAEVDGTDGFTPLALAAAWEPRLQLGVAVTPAYTRGPALLAQSVAAMAEAAPGRFTFGLGASSAPVVERWNGIPYVRPFERTRDTLRFLKRAFTGEKVTYECASFTVSGYRMARPPATPPPILLGALRPGMLRLAGEEADGAILNWLAADDVATCAKEVGAGRQLAARIFVIPTEDQDAARAVGRRMIAAYLNVEAYAEFHRWLGRGEALQAMWDAWASGDRKGALSVVPDEVTDALVLHGSFGACREQILAYTEAGITIPAIAIVPFGVDLRDAVRGLAPAS